MGRLRQVLPAVGRRLAAAPAACPFMSHGLLIVGGGLAAQRAARPCAPWATTAPSPSRARRPASPTTARRSPRRSSPARPTRASGRARGTRSTAISLRLRAPAVRLRFGARTVELAGGERLRYDDLLIATGSRPSMLPALAGFDNVQALRTPVDAERLRGALREGAAVSRDRGRPDRARGRSSARRLGASVTSWRRRRCRSAASSAARSGSASPPGTARTGHGPATRHRARVGARRATASRSSCSPTGPRDRRPTASWSPSGVRPRDRVARGIGPHRRTPTSMPPAT